MNERTAATYSIVWKNRMADIDPSAWDALAMPLETPLFEWEWLRLLEESGSVRAETGWLPYHLTVWSGSRLVAAAPLYVKGHSSGEFVFDHAWADLAERLDIRYYPKLVGMSPFSPVVGYRFLIAPDHDEEKISRLMISAIDRFCIENRLSGCSFLFVDPDWHERIEALGFTSWRHQSYVWKNSGFKTFEDYLAVFNTNQRRNIKRERKTLKQLGITIKALTGEQIQRQLFPLMYDYYTRTNDQYGPWSCKYLTAEFFEGLYAGYRHRLLLMAAFADDDPVELPVGMSFLLTKNDRLYGRYWGSGERLNHLHFNACYYSPIEWAIEHGARQFDPGMGSAHKVRRGFAAVANHSLHRFYDPRLAQILQLHIDEINRQEQQHIDALNEALPFVRH
jgi:predicted N-acyltransferase